MEKKYNLWHILGFHNYTRCIEFNPYGLEPETKIEYSSPWAMFGIKYTRYQCMDCGRKFWMPKGDFELHQSRERFLEEITNQ